jgi:cell fate (sporulation/competence/biofilm development) regulator YlbF (YheA/YmcA/DUF963 family)
MLTEELRSAARNLGETLRASSPVQAYLKAQADCEADPVASELEKRLQALYQELIGRQQRGEALQRNEIDAYNVLKSQVHHHPLIQERDATLSLIKQSFTTIADELSFPLGIEYATLAQAGGV